jgi:hypothetical protein
MRTWTSWGGAALLLLAVAHPAPAAGPAIDWDPAYAWEAGATATSSPAGGEFKMVGVITDFGPPFDDLDPDNPEVEYTFYVHGLISNGTVSTGSPEMTFYTTHYTGGSIEIYCDSLPDASFDPDPPTKGVPADFTDGTLILSGSFSDLVVQTNNFTTYQTGNIEGSFDWTGGTLYSRTFAPGGEPCPALFTGGATWNPAVLIPGYLFRHDGKIDLQCPAAVGRSSWGRIKALHR